jgi:ADP-heptose:LPS heptosyltransferase
MDPREMVKYEFVRYTRGVGLDLGTGPAKCFPQFIGVRRTDDEAYKNAHGKFLEVEHFGALTQIESDRCDFIVAANILLSQEAPTSCVGGVDYIDTMVEWLRCIKVGGHLCVYEPDPSPKAKEMLLHVASCAGSTYPVAVVEHSAWHGGGWYLILRKREASEHGYDVPLTHDAVKRPEKSVCVVRHGGIGDQLQAAFLFPELKRQGYHLTVLTTEKCRDIIAHDPHVDDWFMVDHDHVPNVELPEFWRTVARRYTKFVNLNEAVEGTFLPPPGRPAHAWPQKLRHKMLNHNYAEFAAELAGIPFRAEGEFHPTPEEDLWADEFIANLPGQIPGNTVIGTRPEPLFVILWSLSGSSPHKFTPHQDTVIKRVLEGLRRAVVVMTGDMACQILEVGWDEEPRVVRTSGTLTMRQTLALARKANLVVGPETGVLNSVAYVEDVRKVVLLSHSSIENLTKHWVNAAAIEGVAPCYPCHQLHFTSEFCPQDKTTGAAICQQNVNPSLIYYQIDAEYTGWVRSQMLMRSAA